MGPGRPSLRQSLSSPADKARVLLAEARSPYYPYPSLTLPLTQESFAMLQLLANDCYRAGAFLYAAKAVDTLERLAPPPEYWEGKRGACVGASAPV